MKLESISKEGLVEAIKTASAYLPDPEDLTEDSYDDYQRPHIRKEYDFVSDVLSKLGLSFEDVRKELGESAKSTTPVDLDSVSKEELLNALKISSTYLPHAEDINALNFNSDELSRIEAEFNTVVSALSKVGVTIDDALEEFAIDYPPTDNAVWRKKLCDKN